MNYILSKEVSKMKKGIINEIKTFVNEEPFFIEVGSINNQLLIETSTKVRIFTGITRAELLQFCNESKDNRFWHIFKSDDPYY